MSFLLLVFACGPKQAQVESTPQPASSSVVQNIDEYLTVLTENNRLQGSFAITKNGTPVFTQAYGHLDQAKQIRANTQSMYHIGSISKSFTATMILQLVDEEKITLDQTIDTWFPSVKNAEQITIKHLLRHESGIVNITEDPTYMNWMNDPIAQEDMLAKIAAYPSLFEPGSNSRYSNTNYVLLGYIVERIDDRSLSESLSVRIAQPIKASSTSIGDTIETDQNEADSFRYEGDWVSHPHTDMSIPGGAGAVVSTPTELCLFADALFGGSLISENALTVMTSFEDGRGAGMFQAEINGVKYNTHNGAIDGFRSNLMYQPEDKTCIAYTLNAFNYMPKALTESLVKTSKGEAVEIPSFETVEVNEDTLKTYVGVYKSPQMPLEITIDLQDGILKAQASGQQPFPLTPRPNQVFAFEPAGVEMHFSSTEDGEPQFSFHQAGQSFKYNLKDLSEEPEVKYDTSQLEALVGLYSTDQMPLKIKIELNDGNLQAQADGQSPFPLTARPNGVFVFDMAGIEMHFTSTEEGLQPEFLMKQGPNSFEYKRE